MRILISPYAATPPSGRPSPKSYPHWPMLVKLLNQEGYEVVQVGVAGEDRIDGVSEHVTNFPFTKLRDVMNSCETFVSVDNVWPHFCHYEKLKRGVVLFGPSDPRIFGYPENTNLLRSRDFLRPFQFQTWDAWEWNHLAFCYAENVVPEVVKLAPPPLIRKTTLGAYA